MSIYKYGFFAELAHGDPNGESLAAICGAANYDSTEKDQIVRYLEEGRLYIACPGTAVDVLTTDEKPIGSPNILTDGEWIWPQDLAYYVARYDISVPERMMESMRRNKWTVPDAIDLAAIEL